MTRWKFDSKWIKYIGGTIGGIAAGFVLMVGATKIAYPAVSELVGLSVAQSATTWNSVADAAKGDALSSGILAEAPMLWNGVTFDRQYGSITNGARVDVTRLQGVITPADAYANPTTANQQWSLTGIFNGTTWDRLREVAAADAQAITGILANSNLLFNGATWDRQRTTSATNNTVTTVVGVPQVATLGTWSGTHIPAAATQATFSKTLGGGTVRHVATGIHGCVAAAGTVSGIVILNLRDGATGAGTVLGNWALSVPINGSTCVDIQGTNITGSANTAMTLEFVGAGAAATQETVTLTGYSTP